MKALFDTSVLVASVVDRHPRHASAMTAVRRVIAGHDVGVIAARQGAVGGAVYDALQIECARKTGAERIYTFNVSDFTRLAPDWADRITAP